MLILSSLAVCADSQNEESGPYYETPLISKPTSPVVRNFNPRIDLLNAPSRQKRAIQDGRLKKTSLRAELARGFNSAALNDWLAFIDNQNLDMVTGAELLEDIQYLKSFAKMLQTEIIGRSNNVMNSLTLIDLKLKEQKLIDEEIEGIKKHPGNISTNLGDNLAWKDRLDEIITNGASVHDQFDASLQGMCKVVRRINSFVHSMQKSYINPAHIQQAGPEKQYYPNDQTVLENNHMNGIPTLGPKAGHYSAIGSTAGHTKKTNTKKNKVAKAPINALKAKVVPVVKAIVKNHVNKKVLNPKTNNDAKDALEKIYKEEEQLENLTPEQAKVKTHTAVKQVAKKVAKQVAKRVAKNIHKAPKNVKKAANVLAGLIKKLSVKRVVSIRIRRVFVSTHIRVARYIASQYKAAVPKVITRINAPPGVPVAHLKTPVNVAAKPKAPASVVAAAKKLVTAALTRAKKNAIVAVAKQGLRKLHIKQVAKKVKNTAVAKNIIKAAVHKALVKKFSKVAEKDHIKQVAKKVENSAVAKKSIKAAVHKALVKKFSKAAEKDHTHHAKKVSPKAAALKNAPSLSKPLNTTSPIASSSIKQIVSDKKPVVPVKTAVKVPKAVSKKVQKRPHVHTPSVKKTLKDIKKAMKQITKLRKDLDKAKDIGLSKKVIAHKKKQIQKAKQVADSKAEKVAAKVVLVVNAKLAKKINHKNAPKVAALIGAKIAAKLHVKNPRETAMRIAAKVASKIDPKINHVKPHSKLEQNLLNVQKQNDSISAARIAGNIIKKEVKKQAAKEKKAIKIAKKQGVKPVNHPLLKQSEKIALKKAVKAAIKKAAHFSKKSKVSSNFSPKSLPQVNPKAKVPKPFPVKAISTSKPLPVETKKKPVEKKFSLSTMLKKANSAKAVKKVADKVAANKNKVAPVKASAKKITKSIKAINKSEHILENVKKSVKKAEQKLKKAVQNKIQAIKKNDTVAISKATKEFRHALKSIKNIKRFAGSVAKDAMKKTIVAQLAASQKGDKKAAAKIDKAVAKFKKANNDVKKTVTKALKPAPVKKQA